MILAVDPGLHGAFAWTDGLALSVRDMPTRRQPVNGKDRLVIDSAGVARLLRACRLHADILLIEHVNGMPGQSGPAAFTFGYGVGIIVGAGEALGYRIETVAPSRWKAAMAVPADKDGARAKASEAWPEHSGLWARKMDHDRAEAAMLALYGWKIYGKPNGI